MREILFRGFTPVEKGKAKVFVNGEWINGQWVEGSYWKLNKTTYCFKEDYERDPGNTEHYIVFDQMTDWGLPNRHLQADVLPETVGQYTGLTDKNGKRIFEGDIVNVNTNKDALCHRYEGRNLVIRFDEYHRFVASGRLEYPLCSHYEWEVIGNIHDNPELLEGGAE